MTLPISRCRFCESFLSILAVFINFILAVPFLVIDSNVRKTYSQQIQVFSDKLRTNASQGKITWSQAASEAQQVRNTVMMLLRGKSTPLGRAIAENMKQQGKTLNELIARKSMQLYGDKANFNMLSNKEKNTVYAEIVKSAGKSNARVNAIMSKLSRAGRGLIVISISLSIYTIATADDKLDATKHEVSVTGAGIGGSIAGGALAGLACGPGAPVCVVVGAFVGGALAAFSVDYLW